MSEKREGPKISGRSCHGCKHERDLHHFEGGILRCEVRCAHPTNLNPAFVGDCIWDTPDWCPYIAVPEETHDTCFLICPYCGYQDAEAWELFVDIETGDSISDFECVKCGREFIAKREETIEYVGIRPDEVKHGS